MAAAARAALAADGEPLAAATLAPHFLAVAAATLVHPTGLRTLFATPSTAPQSAGLRLGARPAAVGAATGDAALAASIAAREAAAAGATWWAQRAVAVHQRLLAAPALSLLRAFALLSAPVATTTPVATAARSIETALTWHLLACPAEASAALAAASEALQVRAPA